MSNKRWHLDLDIPSHLLERMWSRSTQKRILNFFKHIELDGSPVILAPPAEVDPLSLAVFAAIYYLPGMNLPPTPFCRIGIFPGKKLTTQFHRMRFTTKEILELSRLARRLQRSKPLLSGPIEYLQKNSQKINDVLFHWIWRCDKVFVKYNSVYREEIGPRSRFGSKDTYTAVIDVIEDYHPSIFSKYSAPYDLLIYCPYYHSWPEGRDDRIVGHLEAFKNINARHKVILTKSSYDYWSRRIQSSLKIHGYGISSKQPEEPKSDYSIRFIIANQLLSLNEALILYGAFRKRRRQISELDNFSKEELLSAIKRLFVSLSSGSDESKNDSFFERFCHLCTEIDLFSEPGVGGIVQAVKTRLSTGEYEKKIDKICEIAPSGSVEYWVTKDGDRSELQAVFAKKNDSSTVVLCDRWLKFLRRPIRPSAVLTRIDKESDLDLLSYLRRGDVVVMTSWEAAIHCNTIEKAWQRSMEWRENARSFNESGDDDLDGDDAVLMFTDFILNERQKVLEDRKTEEQTEQTEEQTWWYDSEVRKDFDHFLTRAEIENAAGNRVECFEVHLDGKTGVFLKENTFVQTLKDDDDADFVSVPIEQLQRGDLLLLFKDAERESLFDIVMDQLSDRDEWRPAVNIIRDWKTRLRVNFFGKRKKISEIVDAFIGKGETVDAVLVRSWIFGPTMAPLKSARIRILADLLGIQDLDLNLLAEQVKRVRIFSRKLGKVLNRAALGKIDDLSLEDERLITEEAGMDLEELRGVVEIKEVLWISEKIVSVPQTSVKRLFSL